MKLIHNFCKTFLFYLLDSFLILLFHPKQSKTVVFIKVDAIGDFFVWLRSAQQLASLYPSYYKILLCNENVYDIAKSLQYFNYVYPVDINNYSDNIFYRLKLNFFIRNINCEVSIQPTISRVFLTGDSLIRITNSRHKIGSKGDLSNIRKSLKFIADKWYTHLNDLDKLNNNEHLQNLHFISQFNYLQKFYDSVDIIKNLPVLGAQFDLPSEYVVIFPGASANLRMWSIDNFIELAIYITNSYCLNVIFCGGINESRFIQPISLISNSRITCLINKTTLSDLVRIIIKSKFIISNETSAVHIAEFFSINSICLLGGGHFGRFIPYPININSKVVPIYSNMSCFNCNWQCSLTPSRHESAPCISNISVNEVRTAVDSLLK